MSSVVHPVIISRPTDDNMNNDSSIRLIADTTGDVAGISVVKILSNTVFTDTLG